QMFRRLMMPVAPRPGLEVPLSQATRRNIVPCRGLERGPNVLCRWADAARQVRNRLLAPNAPCLARHRSPLVDPSVAPASGDAESRLMGSLIRRRFNLEAVSKTANCERRSIA